jgi:hypothetical protein
MRPEGDDVGAAEGRLLCSERRGGGNRGASNSVTAVRDTGVRGIQFLVKRLRV